MKKKSIPTMKLSKRKKRTIDVEKRVTWAFSPVSRVKENKKVYRRKQAIAKDMDV